MPLVALARWLIVVAVISPVTALAVDPARSMEMPMTQAQTRRVRGPFEVALRPQPLADASADASLGRRAIDKQFHGALEAAGRGEMLSAAGSVQGSAGYVAVERVSGTLEGRRGSFVLQHYATMDRGVPMLTITVVPDTGTDELAGLRGAMNIVIEPGGKHFYEFDYTLPAR